jgi:hypothetical protein
MGVLRQLLDAFGDVAAALADQATATKQDTIIGALTTSPVLASELTLEGNGSKLDAILNAQGQTTAQLGVIDGHVDGLEGFTDGVEGLLTTLGTYVDGLEANTANLAKTDVATTLTNGRKTVTSAGTAEALVGSATPCKWVSVSAFGGNTAQVQVGGSGVLASSGASTGRPLFAGDSVTIPVDDVHKVFVDARVSGEGVAFFYGS